MQTLTAMEEEFCLAYCSTAKMVATAAATEAGYSEPEKNAWAIMKRPHIQARIKELMQERSQRLGVDRDWVLAQLLENYFRMINDVKPQLNAKTGKPIEDEDGNPVYTYNAQGALKALEMIGKLTGIDAFNNKLNVEVTKDEELIAAIRAGHKQVSKDSDES